MKACNPRSTNGETVRSTAHTVRQRALADRATRQAGVASKSPSRRSRLDTHVNEGGARGQLALRLTVGTASPRSTQTSAQSAWRCCISRCRSSGARAGERQSRTDHGHANAMFIIGGATRGGRVYGSGRDSTRKLYDGRPRPDHRLPRRVRRSAHKHSATPTEKVFPGTPQARRSFRASAVKISHSPPINRRGH